MLLVRHGADPPDAPWRWENRPVEWLAHSILAATPIARAMGEARKLVIPLVGFAWGFTVDVRGAVAIAPVRRLGADDWREYVPYLREQYPGWEFVDGPDASG